MARRAFIVGGAGQIGRAIGAALLDDGWTVTLSSRGGRPAPRDLIERGASTCALDREQPGALAQALAGGADAVIDTVAYGQDHADQLLGVQNDVGAFVVISSASVYRDDKGRSMTEAGRTGFPDFPQPIRETQATVEPGPDTYATRKVALERRLLNHATAPVAILRPCAIHGPYSQHPREWWFVKRMLDARPLIPLAYGGSSRFHTSAVANIAALTRTILDRPSSGILNAGDPDPPTVTQIGAAIARRLGYEGKLAPLDIGDDKGAAPIGETPWSCPKPFVLDLQAAGALGYRPATTYDAAVPALCDWLTAAAGDDWRTTFPVLAGYPGDLFDYAAEDRFLAAARR